jgi:subtilisin family serine protease
VTGGAQVPGPPRRPAPAALLLVLCLAGAACAGLPPGSPDPGADGAATASATPPVRRGGLGADSPAFSERQVMVTLAPVPPPLLAQRTQELAVAYRLRTVYSWPLASLGEPCVVFEVAGNRAPAEVARRMGSDPRVRSAQSIQLFETYAVPEGTRERDPYAHLQHAAQALRLAEAHRRATGKGVRVAVIDTGVDLDHPDLRGRIAKAGNFVDRGEQTFTSDVHGTAVAGVLAASAGNDVGIVGVAPGAEILALKACWPRAPGTRQAVCNSYTLAKALDAAIAERAQVLNLSLGGPADPLLARLVRAALDRGIVVVAAESSEHPGGGPGFPASVEGVIAVTASGLDGSLPAVRRSGRVLAAPGVDILSTVPRGAYDFFTGSSLAAAQVTGVAALLLERNPRLPPARIRELIEKSARPLPAGPDIGLVDACAAVAMAAGEEGCP